MTYFLGFLVEVVVVAFALENHGDEKTWRLAWKLIVAYFLMRRNFL